MAPQYSSFSDLSNITTQCQSILLRFQGAGITHILQPPDSGIATGLCWRVANNQNYYPKWGISTENSPMALTSSVPGDQYQAVNTMAFGWSPSLDVSSVALYPTDAGRKRCAQIYKGQSSVDYSLCDALDFLE